MVLTGINATTNGQNNEEEMGNVQDDDVLLPINEEDDWVYPNKPKQQHLVSLMRYMYNRQFPADTKFTKEQLLAVQPHHIRCWLNKRAYKPLNGRSSPLRKAKSSISAFYPNQHAPWIEGRGGNPTLHKSINQLIKKVSQLETRGLGAKSNVERGYSLVEFKKVVELLRRQEDFNHHYKYVTMTLWGKHLIHRVDDTCHFSLDSLYGDVEYNFAIRTRTSWSKNVTGFANCPPQILFGSNKWKDYILVHISSYLEAWIGKMTPRVKFLFVESYEYDAEAAVEALKSTFKNRLEEVCCKK
jgi:hypothetical protein